MHVIAILQSPGESYTVHACVAVIQPVRGPCVCKEVLEDRLSQIHINAGIDKSGFSS